ncbi:hypothetical protein D3C77_638020 [compost metagenome]
MFDHLPLQVAEGLVQRHQFDLLGERPGQVAGKLADGLAQGRWQRLPLQACHLGGQRHQFPAHATGSQVFAFRQHVFQAGQQGAQTGQRFLAA